MKWRVAIIIFAALLALLVESVVTRLIADGISFVVSLWCALIPVLVRTRTRARWANYCIIAIGLLGMAMATYNLLRHASILVVTRETGDAIAHWRRVICGLNVTLILALMISGQLYGTKRSGQEAGPKPTE